MTNKADLQKELLEKVKPGVKASELKKLKKSKSADNLTPPSSLPLARSKSAQELESTPTKEQLETKISVLELEVEVKNRELTEKQETITIYSEQLNQKQKDLESLRQQLETAHQELNSLKAQHSTLLDDNLTLKHQGLKDWWEQYQKNQELDQELTENINEASQELINQDEKIASLQSQITKLKLTNQSFQKDLNLATKLAELRKTPFPNPNPNSDYSQLMIYAFLAFWLISLLNSSWKPKDN